MKSFTGKYPAIWQIDVEVDAASLLEEFLSVYADRYEKVYAKNDDWKGVTVFSKGSNLNLDEFPELKKLVGNFGEKNIVGITYFNLAADSTLHEHRDMNGNLLFGILRVHVPLKTNDQAFMFIEREKCHLPVGTAWILDTSGLHALANGALGNRIHLVMDIKKGSKTLKHFPKYTASVVLHLLRFFFIVFSKVLRDIFANPKSLIKRFKDKVQEFIK